MGSHGSTVALLTLLSEQQWQAGRVRASGLSGTQLMSRPLLSFLPQDGAAFRGCRQIALCKRLPDMHVAVSSKCQAGWVAPEAGSRVGGAHPHTDLDGLWEDQRP